MNIRKLDDTVSVSPQIEPGDLAEIARRGFTTVICNRPDAETLGQPEFAAIAAAAREAGLNSLFMPVTAATMGIDVAQEFSGALQQSDGPVLAYCRSGTRCATLWTIAGMIEHRPKQELAEATAKAGYDMSGLLANYGV
ncbi:TIGR01244 family sulfur transferase [Oricola sp.]|uniref:TIGR01244 family sulfur transferase n=1 Tax=Oricola sp. TaxID=1979950 RepID=UPI003BABDFA6